MKTIDYSEPPVLDGIPEPINGEWEGVGRAIFHITKMDTFGDLFMWVWLDKRTPRRVPITMPRLAVFPGETITIVDLVIR